MKSNVRQRAIEWMVENRNVVAMFEQFAQVLVGRQRRFGINLLRERVRWETTYEYGEDAYKFPNDFSPYVARYLLGKHPEWASFMVCRLAKDETDSIEIVRLPEVAS